MGEASRRGTYEQRKAAAIARREAEEAEAAERRRSAPPRRVSPLAVVTLAMGLSAAVWPSHGPTAGRPEED